MRADDTRHMIRQLRYLIVGLPENLGMSRRMKIFIFGGTAVFMAAVAVAVFALLGMQEKTARSAATKFAVALVHNDSDAAPPGAGDYVTGVRAHFGPVTSAKVIGSHNKHINTGDNADTRSFFVSEVLLRTERGPAAIELEFDNHALNSERVSRVYEIEPGDAPGLGAKERKQLETAYAARGGRPADQLALSKTTAPERPAIAPPVPVPASESARPDKRLRCVQRANGDVTKLQECASS